jgi:chemotaxis signal transduction protein
MRAIFLPLAGSDFALPVEVVREAVAAPSITMLPGAPRIVLGIFNLRGEVLPVLDTGAMLGAAVPSSAAYAVVVVCGSDLVALATSAIPAVVDLGEQVQPSETPGTIGTFLYGDRLVTLVDPCALLGHAGLGSPELMAGTG